MNMNAAVIDTAQNPPAGNKGSDVQAALDELQRSGVAAALAIFGQAFKNEIDLPDDRVADVMIEVAHALISAFEVDRQSAIAYDFFRTVGQPAAEVIAGLLELANFPTGQEDAAALSEPIMLTYVGALSSAKRHDAAIAIIARLFEKSPDRQYLAHALGFAQRKQTDLPNDGYQPSAALQMRSFVVNLDRQATKYAGFLERNAGCDFNFERLAASDGAQMSHGDVMTMRLVAPGTQFTPGAVGCAMSHRRIWTWVVEQGVPALVFEDDATVRHDANEKLAALLPTLGSWDYVTLGCNLDSILDVELAPGMTSTMVFQPKHPNDHTDAAFQRSASPVAGFRLKACFGTPGYAVSPAGARKLLQLSFPMDNRPYKVPLLSRELNVVGIDGMMNCLYSHIEAYACFPALVVPRNDRATSTTTQTADFRRW